MEPEATTPQDDHDEMEYMFRKLQVRTSLFFHYHQMVHHQITGSLQGLHSAT